jgi:hypothetical protein
MEKELVVWSLGPVGRGYLYVGDVFIGAAEEARLAARPVDPRPGTEPGFVELSVRLGHRQVARLNALDRPISDMTQWRFKVAGPDPWSFPEYVIELGSGSLTEVDPRPTEPRSATYLLVIRSEWERVDQGGRPWFCRPSSAQPDVSLLGGPEARS